MSESAQVKRQEERRLPLPVEVEVYIEADGTVTFADLEAGMLPVARELNPDEPLACDVPAASSDEPAADEEHDV